MIRVFRFQSALFLTIVVSSTLQLAFAESKRDNVWRPRPMRVQKKIHAFFKPILGEHRMKAVPIHNDAYSYLCDRVVVKPKKSSVNDMEGYLISFPKLDKKYYPPNPMYDPYLFEFIPANLKYVDRSYIFEQERFIRVTSNSFYSRDSDTNGINLMNVVDGSVVKIKTRGNKIVFLHIYEFRKSLEKNDENHRMKGLFKHYSDEIKCKAL